MNILIMVDFGCEGELLTLTLAQTKTSLLDVGH